MEHAPLFFLTDFGLSDPYVGIMKAVALAIGHRGPLVDLTHAVPPQDVAAGMVALEEALPHLPARAVVVAVVDPGVGTARRPAALRVRGRVFIGPDNGLLHAADPHGHGQWRLIEPWGPIKAQPSSTFHGRDIFAPAAALLAAHLKHFEQLGPLLTPPAALLPPPPPAAPPDALPLRVVWIDHFGNCALSLRHEAALQAPPEHHHLYHGPTLITSGLRRTYGEVAPGQPLLYYNSAGRLELAVSHGSAAARYNLHRGEELLLLLRPHPAPAPPHDRGTQTS